MRIRNIRTVGHRPYIYIYIIGERSEPLSMVFNDQPRDIYIYVTRSEKTYHFAQKLKKRYKQKSRKKSFFNTKLFLAYLKIQLLGYLLAKFQHLKRYSFAKRAAQRELLLFSSRGRLYVNGN